MPLIQIIYIRFEVLIGLFKISKSTTVTKQVTV